MDGLIIAHNYHAVDFEYELAKKVSILIWILFLHVDNLDILMQSLQALVQDHKICTMNEVFT